MRPSKLLLLVVLAALALSASQADAQAGSSGLPGGDLALRTADGNSVTLNSLMGENGLLVMFWTNVCPWTERYASRVVALARDYQPAGINFAAVNSNDSVRYPEEDVASMRRIAASASFSFPYLVDADGATARAMSARNTPQLFLYNASGGLVYDGAIDDSPADPARVQSGYAQEAMDLLLAGQSVAVQQTNALGCTIKLPN